MEEINVYEEQVNEETEVNDLIPVEAEPEEEAGIGTGAVIALSSLATAGLIWLGSKVVKWGKRRKAKKAAEAAEEEYEEIPEEIEEEPVPEEAEEA